MYVSQCYTQVILVDSNYACSQRETQHRAGWMSKGPQHDTLYLEFPTIHCLK